MDRPRRATLVAAGVALLAGLLVTFLAFDLFPYHSVNDDEGVYLLQAAMLLDGQLFLRPGALGELVRPWFFVAREGPSGLLYYPKYAPVPAAIFAVGQAAGNARYALGVVAAGNAALVYALTATAFDRKTGVLAALALVGSPLFLLTSAVFLPYAPTTLLNLVFAFAYVRAVRRESVEYAVLAGVAVGAAFFARPFTAVLFAAPFVAHTLLVLRRSYDTPRFRSVFTRSLAIVVLGLVGVGVALGYNAVVTGDPLLFPYEAFAPRDGVGFGHREILNHDVQYTPALAAETTIRVLVAFATEWTVAAPVGTLLAAVGLSSLRWPPGFDADGLSDAEVRWLLAGLFPAVVLGNAYFWGSLNVLENGFVDLFGPFYHFDLLLPLSAFAAAGVVVLGRRSYRVAHARTSPTRARALLLAALVLSVPIVAVAEHRTLTDPMGDHRTHTETLASAYEPFTERSFENAVVFLPPTYGEWLQHPFQYLRNDPEFDGETIYTLDTGPDAEFAALDATDRRPYRFAYRGTWIGANEPVEPVLRRLRVLEGPSVEATAEFGVPARATHASIRLETDEGYARLDAGAVSESLSVSWDIGPDGVRVTDAGGSSRNATTSLPSGVSDVHLVVTFVEPTGTTVTYRQSVAVEKNETGVRVIWPPETRVCRLTTDCGRDRTYVGPDGSYLSGVSVETNATPVYTVSKT